jgi:hypothetical protein
MALKPNDSHGSLISQPFFFKKIENWFKYVINIFKMLRKPLFFDGVLMKTKGCFNFPKNKTAGVNKLKHQHTILFYFIF